MAKQPLKSKLCKYFSTIRGGVMSRLKPKLRLKPFLFIRNTKAVYEQPDGEYDVYDLFKFVFPFVYKWTGTWTIHKRGSPVDHEKLRRIIREYKEKGHV